MKVFQVVLVALTHFSVLAQTKMSYLKLADFGEVSFVEPGSLIEFTSENVFINQNKLESNGNVSFTPKYMVYPVLIQGQNGQIEIQVYWSLKGVDCLIDWGQNTFEKFYIREVTKLELEQLKKKNLTNPIIVNHSISTDEINAKKIDSLIQFHDTENIKQAIVLLQNLKNTDLRSKKVSEFTKMAFVDTSFILILKHDSNNYQKTGRNKEDAQMLFSEIKNNKKSSNGMVKIPSNNIVYKNGSSTITTYGVHVKNGRYYVMGDTIFTGQTLLTPQIKFSDIPVNCEGIYQLNLYYQFSYFANIAKNEKLFVSQVFYDKHNPSNGWRYIEFNNCPNCHSYDNNLEVVNKKDADTNIISNISVSSELTKNEMNLFKDKIPIHQWEYLDFTERIDRLVFWSTESKDIQTITCIDPGVVIDKKKKIVYIVLTAPKHDYIIF